MEEPENKGPIEVIRDGTIKASIWQNEGENGTYLKVKFSGAYQKDGEWHDTDSFSGRELLAIAEVARQAYCYGVNYRSMQKDFKREP